MTTKNFVVKNGITTGSITLDASSGNISGTNLSVTGVSNLGAVGNVKVTGGSANYVITTDGSGNLSFTDPTATQSPAPMPTYVAVGNTLTISSNYQGLFGYPITVDGTIVVDGILVDVNDATVPAGNINYVQYNNGNTMGGDANFYYTAVNGTMTVKNETITGNSTIGNLVVSTTANLGSSSNVKITGGINGYLLQTDGAGNLSWSAGGGSGNGVVGGANTQVQFNDAGAFGGNSSFTFNKTTGVLVVTGNITGGNLTTGGVISATGNITGSFILGNGSQLTGITATTATTAGTVTTNAQPNITSTGTLASLSVSGNANIGNIGTAGLITATGNINAGNLITGGIVSATGNITGANMFTAGNVTASQLISNVTTGTAPLTVTSTTRVGNLNVAYANVSDFISVAAGTGNNFIIFANAATGNITELTSTGLIANLSNNSITATTFVGALSGAATSATTAGTVTTAAQPNITSVGTLTSVSVSGNANIGNIGTAGLITATGNITGGNLTTGGQLNVTGVATAGGAVLEVFNVGGTNIALYGGGSAQTGRTILGWNRTAGGGEFDIITNRNGGGTGGVKFYDWANTLTNTTTEIFSVTGTGAVTTPSTISATGNITGGNVIGTLLTGTLSTAAQPNITSVGTLTGLGVNGTITGVNITANTGVFTGNGSALTALNASNVSSGTLAQARLANASVTLGSTALTLGSTVTTVAGLTSVTSTTFVGALTGAATSATTAGTVTTAAQPNITSVGTLTSVSVSGNAAAGNVTVTGYHFRSVATGISAAGSTQGTATAISKEINVVSTVASGAGVVLPTAVAGMAITITNTSANSLLVYPATSGIINSLSANAGYTQPAGATLQFVAPTTTQWYTIGATYV